MCVNFISCYVRNYLKFHPFLFIPGKVGEVTWPGRQWTKKSSEIHLHIHILAKVSLHSNITSLCKLIVEHNIGSG
jgi:hypothetical protein